MSDHRFVQAIINIENTNLKSKHINFRKINLENFKNDLMSSQIMSNNIINKTVDEIAHIYDHSLHDLLNKHAPQLTKIIKIKDISPWYSEELRNLKKVIKKTLKTNIYIVKHK